MNVHFSIQDIRLLFLEYKLIGRQSEETSAEPVENTVQSEIEITVEIACESNYDDANRLLRVMVTASLRNEPDLGFSLSAKMGGLFLLDADPDEKVLRQIQRISGPAIIYPYLREVIAETTRKAGYDPIHLPPVNFVKMADLPK